MTAPEVQPSNAAVRVERGAVLPQARVARLPGGDPAVERADRSAARIMLGAACCSPVVLTALKVALVVGTLLNLINQGEALLVGAAISWPRVLLNYAVPYLVSTYSAAQQALRNCAL